MSPKKKNKASASMTAGTPEWRFNAFLFLVAALLSLALFSIRANVDLNLADEGYLWYGADRTYHGEVPLRDFRSYDPGRYYWSAFWFWAFRPGIIPLRLSETLFQVIGLFLALLAAKRYTRNLWELSALAFLLALWMFPGYKYFDCALPMAALFFGVWLLERATPLACWASGVFVGFSAFIGRNHFLYLTLSFLVLMISMTVTLRRNKAVKKSWLAWGGGLLCGWSPLFLMEAFVGGFARSYWVVFQSLFRWGTTNLHLPVPWPWEPHFDWPLDGDQLAVFIMGLLFLAVPLFYGGWLWKARRDRPGDRLLFTCAAVGLPYLHYAFSRADFEHLATVLAPFWMGFCAQGPFLAPKRWSRVFLVAALVLSFFSALPKTRLLQCLDPSRYWPIEYTLGKDCLFLSPFTAGVLETAKRVAASAGPGNKVLFFPHLPTLYAALQSESPLFDIYALFPCSDGEQRRMVADLQKKGVTWALIGDDDIDARDELRFHNADRLVWDYLGSRSANPPHRIGKSDFWIFGPLGGSAPPPKGAGPKDPDP